MHNTILCTSSLSTQEEGVGGGTIRLRFLCFFDENSCPDGTTKNPSICDE
ncbi:hypothetical protein CP10743SC13_0690 [Chlamydia psittaci 10_743_SC13]|nr:hypothetical protein CP10743SC13_0690 [Chlamydia psittaci 10_743_SC13]